MNQKISSQLSNEVTGRKATRNSRAHLRMSRALAYSGLLMNYDKMKSAEKALQWCALSTKFERK